MDQGYFRRFAHRCRDLMGRTHSDSVREQLCLWATEFEARADEVEGGAGPSGEGIAAAPTATDPANVDAAALRSTIVRP